MTRAQQVFQVAGKQTVDCRDNHVLAGAFDDLDGLRAVVVIPWRDVRG
ncbi:hypothetical protein ACFRJ9_19675 [Paenarthrobacter sp. NPDC056912]